MIMGEGGTGKSAVLNEILENHSIHIVLIREGRMEFCHATDGESGCCAYLIECQGWQNDNQLTDYLQASTVEFLADPSY